MLISFESHLEKYLMGKRIMRGRCIYPSTFQMFTQMDLVQINLSSSRLVGLAQIRSYNWVELYKTSRAMYSWGPDALVWGLRKDLLVKRGRIAHGGHLRFRQGTASGRIRPEEEEGVDRVLHIGVGPERLVTAQDRKRKGEGKERRWPGYLGYMYVCTCVYVCMYVCTYVCMSHKLKKS